jgi:hypothetical protein
MPNYEPLDYRLRCHTKRTDLPPDVLRDISEAYVRLLNLEEACNKNKHLQAERDEARRDVCSMMHMTGFLAGDYANSKGWDCFKDGYTKFSDDVKNFRDIWYDYNDKVTAERDEARRNLCDLYVKGQPSSSSMTAHDYAAELGWDCFKENNDGTSTSRT